MPLPATITKSPLPKLDSARIQKLGWSEISEFYRAYDNVLQAEEYAMCKSAEGELISARVAGYLLLEFSAQSRIFKDEPSKRLVSWFTSPPQSPHSTQHDVIFDCGTFLRDRFIRMFRTNTTQYSPPSPRPSRPSFDTLQDLIKDSIQSTGKSYKASRKKMLARDGYRCVFTGAFDRAPFEQCSEVRERKNIWVLSLQTTCIFNKFTMQNTDPVVGEDSRDGLSDKARAAPGALAILESFGFSKFAEAFKEAGGAYNIWNLLTLAIDLHDLFSRLELWFERTEKPHRYKVRTHCEYQTNSVRDFFKGHDRNIEGAPMFVEFNAQHETEAPPPDPDLLALHATCARVMHMSGAAEFFEQIEEDMEDRTVLASDGSSAALLSYLISPYAVIDGVI